MNDPMNHDPFDRELEQLLGRAFAARPDGPVSTPSMLDVRHRARLRHRRRAGAMVGSVALVGVGGVAVLAQGHDGADRVSTPGAGSDDGLGVPSTTALCAPVTTFAGFPTTTVTVLPGDADIDTTSLNDAATSTNPDGADPTLPPFDCAENGTTVWACTGGIGPDGKGNELYADCVPVDPNGTGQSTVTTIPCGVADPSLPCSTLVPTTTGTICGPSVDCTAPTTTVGPIGTYVLQTGDTPGSVAVKFDVSVADLDAINAGSPGYDNFVLGTTILIPPSRPIGTSTTITIG